MDEYAQRISKLSEITPNLEANNGIFHKVIMEPKTVAMETQYSGSRFYVLAKEVEKETVYCVMDRGITSAGMSQHEQSNGG